MDGCVPFAKPSLLLFQPHSRHVTRRVPVDISVCAGAEHFKLRACDHADCSVRCECIQRLRWALMQRGPPWPSKCRCVLEHGLGFAAVVKFQDCVNYAAVALTTDVNFDTGIRRWYATLAPIAVQCFAHVKAFADPFAPVLRFCFAHTCVRPVEC